MATAEGVEILPQDLKFRFALNKQMLTTISITNNSAKRIGFKIKTTAPKKYVVRPSSGIAEHKSSISVQVIMQAQKDYPTDFQNCKDKFMVQTVEMAEGEDLDKDTFNKDVKKEALKEARLRVVLEGPAAPPSPVPEASEHDEEVSRALAPSPPAAAQSPGESRQKTVETAHAAPAAADGLKEANALKAQLDRITTERDDLRRAVDQLQLMQRGNSSSTSARKKGIQLSIVHIIVVAILAFLLGHFT